MPINISNKMKRSLPQEQKQGIEEFLWKKSNGACFLCEQPLNKSKDHIEADHDEPESNGGKTNRDNLNLVHRSCNRFKRNNPSITVRPYLRFYAYLEKKRFDIQYGDVLSFFGITPSEIDLEFSGDEVEFHLPDGKQRAKVFEEAVGSTVVKFTFIEVSKTTLWNDDECQPRTIKPKHILSLYSDILSNPLHEPPGCRLKKSKSGYKLLMFDGQHKTVSCWLAGRSHIAVKVYLDFSREQAIRLVNSVQSRIKKLPLSSFELASKFEEEWRVRFEDYVQKVGEEHSSEKGFLDWIERDEKPRAKKALEAALVKSVIENPDLSVRDYIEKPGVKMDQKGFITETTFQNNLVKQLVDFTPRDETGELGRQIRERELKTIITIINDFARKAFDPNDGGELTENDLKRRDRLSYQASLKLFSKMIRGAVSHILLANDEKSAFTEKDLDSEKIQKIQEIVSKFVDHPVWTAKLEGSEKLKDVDNALTRNQGFDKAFNAVHLTKGYLVGVDNYPNEWWE